MMGLMVTEPNVVRLHEGALNRGEVGQVPVDNVRRHLEDEIVGWRPREGPNHIVLDLTYFLKLFLMEKKRKPVPKTLGAAITNTRIGRKLEFNDELRSGIRIPPMLATLQPEG